MAGSGTAHLRDDDDIILRAEHLVVEFPAGDGAKVHAVSDVSFDLREGETIGLVGESGCGKSTTGRAVMQLPRPTSGNVMFESHNLVGMRPDDLRRVRTRLQMIFQDPISSLNPRRKVKDIVGEPLRIWKSERNRGKAVEEVLDAVGLDLDLVGDRRPHQFSGGQCQRISIARSLVLNPKVLICDEPVSALDVSIQAQIINLLEDMKALYGLTLLFIAHDLAVVKNVSDRVIVMYLGKMCEIGNPDVIYDSPAHPYTRALLSSIPVPDPSVVPAGRGIVGEIPSPISPPSGCRFRTRCPRASSQCAAEEPLLTQLGDDHFVACHHPHVVPVTVSSANGAVA